MRGAGGRCDLAAVAVHRPSSPAAAARLRRARGSRRRRLSPSGDVKRSSQAPGRRGQPPGEGGAAQLRFEGGEGVEAGPAAQAAVVAGGISWGDQAVAAGDRLPPVDPFADATGERQQVEAGEVVGLLFFAHRNRLAGRRMRAFPQGPVDLGDPRRRAAAFGFERDRLGEGQLARGVEAELGVFRGAAAVDVEQAGEAVEPRRLGMVDHRGGGVQLEVDHPGPKIFAIGILAAALRRLRAAGCGIRCSARCPICCG